MTADHFKIIYDFSYFHKTKAKIFGLGDLNHEKSKNDNQKLIWTRAVVPKK